MKLCYHIPRAKGQAGIMLVQCVVYFALFLMLSGAAMCAFYFCMDGSQRLISGTDEINAALTAGERWRADVRNASGPITVEKTSSGEMVKMPEGEMEIVYSFDGDEMQRLTGTETSGKPLLPKLKLSEMTQETRGSVKAWRWELELAPHRKDVRLHLLFMFEAAQKTS